MDIQARQEGYLTPTYISKLLEKELPTLAIPYEIRDKDWVFQPKSGGMEKGETGTADRQMSVYLSDFAYDRVGEIAGWLKENVNRKISPAFVIRDILYGILEEG